MIYFNLIAFVWFVCGVLTWGFYNGQHKNAEYAWCDPRLFMEVFVSFLGGPIALLATILTYGVHHFDLRPITRAERWEIYKQKFQNLVDHNGETIDNFDKD